MPGEDVRAGGEPVLLKGCTLGKVFPHSGQQREHGQPAWRSLLEVCELGALCITLSEASQSTVSGEHKAVLLKDFFSFLFFC